MRLEELLAMFALPALDELLTDVDNRLLAALTTTVEPLGTGVRRVASVPGKRLRPIMTMAVAYHCVSEVTGEVRDSAAAIELVQIGSLVHDDLFEQADARRAVPTINHVEGENIALMAGDFILARAAVLAARGGPAVAQLLARTVAELCEGQLAEMRDQNNPDRELDAYLASIRGKTGVLFSAACQAGAYAAGASEELAAAVGAYGEQFGMAFQLLDDVLDFVGDPERLMKPVGIDLETGVYTLPVLLAMQRPDGTRLRHLLRRRTPDDIVSARGLIIGAGTIIETLAEANTYADAAAAELSNGSTGDLGVRLGSFGRAYLGWALEHFAPDVRRYDVG